MAIRERAVVSVRYGPRLPPWWLTRHFAPANRDEGKFRTMRKPQAPLVAVGVTLGCVLPASPAQAASARQDRVERSVLRQVNALRAQHGLRRLRRSRALARSADQKALEIVWTRTMSHASPDGTPMAMRVRRHVRARRVGETLAAVPARRKQASAIVSAWMRSPLHRSQILSGSFRRVGIGRRTGRLAGATMSVMALDLASAR
jgi:uncharacterized protein YkwD